MTSNFAGLEERRANAKKIAEKLIQLHGENILAIGLYGSVARGDCGPYSDVEIFVLTEKPIHIKENALVVNGVIYFIYCDMLEHVLEELKQADDHLAVQPKYLTALWLYDPHNVRERILKAIKEIPDEQYHEAAQYALHGLYEYYCKLQNACARKDLINAIYALDTMLSIAAMLVAIINRKQYLTENSFYTQHVEFAKLPQGYSKYVEKVRLNKVRELDEVCETGRGLWASLLKIAQENGIGLNIYKSLEDYWPAELE